MNRLPITSSNIKSIGYDNQLSILEVEFISGDVYQYYDVPEHLYQEFMHASSLGGFINDTIIKYHYRYKKIS